MIFRFLHVSVTPMFTPLNRQAIEKRLSDLGRDWMSYNSISWVLWTNKSILTVSEMLMGDINAEDQLLVIALSPAEVPNGRLPGWVWEWFNRPRNWMNGDIQTPALPAPNAQNIFEEGSLGGLLPPNPERF